MRFAHGVVICGILMGIAAGQQPTVNQNGVVNASNFSAPNPPGSLVVIFGENMASKAGELLLASSTPLTTRLQNPANDVSVTIDNTAAPVYYVSKTQSSVQVPWGVSTPDSGTANVNIVVTRNGTASSAQQMAVGRFSPGIFTVAQNGLGMGLAFDNTTGTIAQPAGTVPGRTAIPAKIGDNLFLYATGLGPVTPAISDGAAPCPLSGCPAGVVLSKTTATVDVLVGGVKAVPQFAGLAPQFVGVYQVNFQVAAGTPKGNAVPLQVQIAGTSIISSDKVTIAVQ